MSTDETREALTAMVREGKAAGMYADHGAAGFCTNHGQAALDVAAIRAEAERRWPGPVLVDNMATLNNFCRAGFTDGAQWALAARDAEVERLTRLAEGIKREADGFYENRNLWQRRTEKAEDRADAAEATVARVEALAADSRDRGGFGGVRLVAHVRIADLRAALAAAPSETETGR